MIRSYAGDDQKWFEMIWDGLKWSGDGLGVNWRWSWSALRWYEMVLRCFEVIWDGLEVLWDEELLGHSLLEEDDWARISSSWMWVISTDRCCRSSPFCCRSCWARTCASSRARASRRSCCWSRSACRWRGLMNTRGFRTVPDRVWGVQMLVPVPRRSGSSAPAVSTVSEGAPPGGWVRNVQVQTPVPSPPRFPPSPEDKTFIVY